MDLHPEGFGSSVAFGTDGSQQVGTVSTGIRLHASLWQGSASTWVDLDPGRFSNSEAYGVGGGQQAGYVEVGYPPHASVWTGSADSWVDLHPAGAWGSIAYAADGGQQIGVIYCGGEGNDWGIPHASLWSGSATSWVDLTPAGALRSAGVHMGSGYQVGWSLFPGDSASRASLWSGSSASWVDLSRFVPPEYEDAYSKGVWSDGHYIYIVGYAHNTSDSRANAIMWVGPVPEPASLVGLATGLSALALRRRGRPVRGASHPRR